MNGSGAKDDYDEIDQIYDYVRGFAPLPKHIRSPFANKEDSNLKRSVSAEVRPVPPPIETMPTKRNDLRSNEKLSPSVHPALISAVLEKAERRVEKRSRKSDEKKKAPQNHKHPAVHQQITPPINAMNSKNGNKLFIKATQSKNNNKTHMFRQKSNSPVKETPPSDVVTPLTNTSPSSLFRMRYKSLTNLAMELDTLDSSTSCGKNSADSSGSAAIKARIPEKKSRRGLARPKSLTNLMWDCRGSMGALNNPPDVVGGAARAIVETERRMRLEPGVYRHGRDAPALLAATTRLLASQKKIGTLYL